jgi:beta-glucosidase/6-phospho-beta-glucosidase/beta-galactosidase
VFKSFVMAGFECTYARTEKNYRLDMLSATQHDIRCRDDYRLLKELGIYTVREGLAWNQIDDGSGNYDFGRFEEMMAVAGEENMQQIWDLNHFDYPDYLDPFSDEFVSAFGRYARQAVRIMKKHLPDPLWVIPINEMSFFAWIGADQGKWAPFTKGSKNGLAFKKQLARATMAAIDSIRQEHDPVRFIISDPFMRRVAREPASKGAKRHATIFNTVVRFEAWDILSGLAYPELGGAMRYLDVVGVNYYLHNQEWVLSKPHHIGHQMMDWESDDRISFADMLSTIHERYSRPLIVSETGSFGNKRADWWKRTFAEVDEAVAFGLPVHGVCAYPVLDRLDAVNYLLPESGIWDFDQSCSTCDRIPHAQSVDIIRKYIARRQQPPSRSAPIYPST